MAKMSWRETILRALLAPRGEMSYDALVESAEGEDDIARAETACQALVEEGVLVEVPNSTEVRIADRTAAEAALGRIALAAGCP